MSTLQKNGEKTKYDFYNADCLGAECFAPGQYQHRGATASGSRNTGSYSSCCMTRAYRGCPDQIIHSEELVKARKAEGWKVVVR